MVLNSIPELGFGIGSFRSDSKNLHYIFHRGASESTLQLVGCKTIEEAKEALESGADINEKNEDGE